MKKEIGMLAITMKANEFFTIGEEILVYFEKVGQSQVKIKIKAPKKLGVKRHKMEGVLDDECR